MPRSSTTPWCHPWPPAIAHADERRTPTRVADRATRTPVRARRPKVPRSRGRCPCDACAMPVRCVVLFRRLPCPVDRGRVVLGDVVNGLGELLHGLGDP